MSPQAMLTNAGKSSLSTPAMAVTRAGLGTLNHTALTLEALERRGIPAQGMIAAWPAHPDLVHHTNLDDLPTAFKRSASGWLSEAMHCTCDDPRKPAAEEG
jgi:dethiobiotin synthetase